MRNREHEYWMNNPTAERLRLNPSARIINGNPWRMETRIIRKKSSVIEVFKCTVGGCRSRARVFKKKKKSYSVTYLDEIFPEILKD